MRFNSEFLRKAMAEANETTAGLHLRLNREGIKVSLATVCNWVSGRVRRVDGAALLTLARLFGIEASLFYVQE